MDKFKTALLPHTRVPSLPIADGHCDQDFDDEADMTVEANG